MYMYVTYLWAKVSPASILSVLNGDRLDPSEHHIFGHFHPQAFHSGNQDIGVGHSSHRFMSKHISIYKKKKKNM